MSRESKYIVKDDLTSAYVDSLKIALRDHYVFALVTEVERPILEFADNELSLSGLNLDKEMHRRFEAFQFKDGRTGKEWIEDRIHELFAGLYHVAISKHGQLDFAQSALKEILRARADPKRRGTYNWLYNRIFCLTCHYEDRKFSHLHLSKMPNPPCLTLLDFKPEQEKLHLIAFWRAQYFDTKAYGNLISLAVLLGNVCRYTGFQSGHVISIASKAIFKNMRDGKSLVRSLES